jgi:5-methylcytosine-specific restriction endonuclease McrA
MTRRSKSQSFGFEADSKYSGNEFILKKCETHTGDFGLKVTTEDTNLPEVFDLGSGMIAGGGYVKVTKPASVTIKAKIDNDIIKEKQHSLDTKIWEGVGVHSKHPLGTYDLTVEFEFTSCSDECQFNIFGFNAGALDHWIFVDNYIYDDGKSARYRFFEEEYQYAPSKYYLGGYSQDTGKLDNGDTIVLKTCNRAPEHYLPIEVGENEDKCETFVNHIGNSNLKISRQESTVDAYEYTGEISERIIRPRKFRTNQSHPGFLYDSHVFVEYLDDNKNFNEYIEIEGLVLEQGYQYECSSCKKFEVNSEGNSRRTPEQRFEDSQRRRSIERLLRQEKILDIDMEKDFRRRTIEEFGGCVSCGESDSDKLEIDHIMPMAYLWPLDGNAAPLCHSCHKPKGTTFPKEFYSEDKRNELIESERVSIGKDIHKKKINEEALNSVVQNIEWFFEEFLSKDSRQRENSAGIRVSEKIVSSIHRKLRDTNNQTDLVQEYKKQTGTYPTTVDPDSVED